MKAIGKFSLSNKHKKNKKSTDSAKKNKDKKEKKEKKAKKKSTDKKKEKAEKKKKKEKKQQDSDSSSDSNSDPRTEEPTAKTEAKEGVVKSNEKLDKKLGPLPGACLKFPNHSSFALKILMEERPDLLADGGTIDSAEAEMLDKYVKEKSEFQEEDAFHSNDNFDEDERCFISYSVFLKYNEGRYSALYIVTKQLCTNNDLHDEPGCFMLKTGLRKNSITNNARMQREMRVMKELLPVARKNVVLPTLVECGKACDMNYIVMTMLDNNLEKLKEDLGGKFKLPSAIYIAQETFNCITELHAHKYIHRDVKPMNFCIGMNQNRFRIYIIDFGESVRPGTVLKLGSPDAATLPFCSLDAHRNDAAREKMDMESWFYMICDIIQPGCISWKGSFDEEEVLAEKKKFWTELKTRVGDSRLQSIGELVILKNEYNKNDQNKIRSLLQEAREAALNGAKLQLDWIAPPPVVAVRKVKTAK